jgi:hypothetical protein
MRRRRPARHEEPPVLVEEGAGDPETAARAAASEILNSDYAPGIKWLGNELLGKVVTRSIGGHAGSILWFDDCDWVAAWLDPYRAEMRFSVGDGDPPETVRAFLSNPEVPNASGPLDVDRIYAKETNDIAAEARETHGKPARRGRGDRSALGVHHHVPEDGCLDQVELVPQLDRVAGMLAIRP